MSFYQGILAVWDIASTLTKTGNRRIGSHGPATQERTSRMLKKTASGVLASRRGSTYRRVRLATSLAAALLDGPFEHPVRHEENRQTAHRGNRINTWFSAESPSHFLSEEQSRQAL